MTDTPTILAIDTATQVLSVALSTPRGVLQRTEEARDAHTEHILGLIDEVLQEGKLNKDDLDAIAFGAGPGAFTGLRVACGIAQGLAWGLGKPLIAIGNLEAAANAYAQDARVLVALDARMRECYTGVYKTDATGLLEEICEPALCAPEAIESLRLETGADTVLGSGLEAYPEIREQVAGSANQVPSFQVDAKAVLALALKRFQVGKTIDPKLAAPLYVRNRVALTIAERAMKKA